MAELPRPRLVWSVGALLEALDDALASRFPVCTVRGEVSGFNRAPSGHAYFALRDADGASAVLRCAMFRRAASMLGFSPEDGQLVEVRGRLALYQPRGELQLVVESMQPAGAGALYERFLRLKARLETEGLFEAGRKRELPRFPSAVGLVTSLGGAALHDVATCLARRAPHLRVVIYPSLVQGPEAPEALVAAIELANRRAEVDVVLLCRGGGSLEDLWSFNDERVVRAVAASVLPIVSAVGHETDVTLADLAADLRAPTPSSGAELIAPLHAKLLEHLAGQAVRLMRAAVRRFDTLGQRLDRAAAQLARPDERLGRERLRLALLAGRLRRAAAAGIERRGARLSAAALRLRAGAARSCERARQRERQLSTRLAALDPRRVVARGYALVQTRSGQLVVSPAQVDEGAELKVTLAEGAIELQAQAVRRA